MSHSSAASGVLHASWSWQHRDDVRLNRDQRSLCICLYINLYSHNSFYYLVVNFFVSSFFSEGSSSVSSRSWWRSGSMSGFWKRDTGRSSTASSRSPSSRWRTPISLKWTSPTSTPNIFDLEGQWDSRLWCSDMSGFVLLGLWQQDCNCQWKQPDPMQAGSTWCCWHVKLLKECSWLFTPLLWCLEGGLLSHTLKTWVQKYILFPFRKRRNVNLLQVQVICNTTVFGLYYMWWTRGWVGGYNRTLNKAGGEVNSESLRYL